ncbi:Fanconi anemia group B protein [Lampetra fluviatilis]
MSIGDSATRAAGPFLLPHGNFVVLFTTATTATGQRERLSLEVQAAKFDPGTHVFKWSSAGPRWVAPSRTRTLDVLFCGRSPVRGAVRSCVLLHVQQVPVVIDDDDVDDVDEVDNAERRMGIRRTCRSYVVLSLETGRCSPHPDHFETRLEFDSPSGPRGADVALVSGSTVVWWRDGQIYVATATNSTSSTSSNVIVQTFELLSTMDVFWVGEFYGQLTALGRTSSSSSIISSNDWVLSAEWISVPLQKTSSLPPSVPPSLPVPHEYAGVTRCLWTSDRQDGLAVVAAKGDDVDARDDMVVVVIATSARQLLEFASGGKAPRMCALPFGDARGIFEMRSGWCGDGALLVQSEGGGMCAVWRETFQVAACWEGVRAVLVGDFAGTGCDQAMLLHGDSAPRNPLQEFTITDLGPVAYTSVESAEDVKEEAMEESSLEKCEQMVQVLETRLQVGLSELRELQLLSQEKQRVIGRAAGAVAAIPDGASTPSLAAVPSGLVSMFDDEVGNEDRVLEDVLQEPAVALTVRVKQIWQRVIDDSWVIGVDLEWTNERRPRHLRLLLLDESSSPHSPRCILSSRCLPLHPPDDAAVVPPFIQPPSSGAAGLRSPPAKRSQVPDSRRIQGEATFDRGSGFGGSVVAVTPLPVFTGVGERGGGGGEVASRLLLLALDADGGGGGDDDDDGRSGAIRESVEGDATKAWTCGVVTLGARDVSDGKFAPRLFEEEDLTQDEAAHDVQALSAVRPWGSLSLHSRDVALGGALSSLVSTLGRAIPATPPSVSAAAAAAAASASSSRPTLILTSQRRHGPLRDTAVLWTQKGPFDARLEFIARSSASLCALMAAVRSSLPCGANLSSPDPSPGLGLSLSRCLDVEITASLAHGRLILGPCLPPEPRGGAGGGGGDVARDLESERGAFARETERRRGAAGRGAAEESAERLRLGRKKAAMARAATDAIATRLAATIGRGAARWQC